MQKGEITAFLSLIFVLLVSFIAAMLESTVLQVSKNQKRLDADRAIFSIFGEYEKSLLESYDILALDSSYGTDTSREGNLTDRMRYYGTEDMEHNIAGIQYLTDRRGRPFREQAVAYMEDVYGLSAIQDWIGKTEFWEEQKLQGEEAGKQEIQGNLEFENALENSENGLLEEGNPLPHMEEIKKSGIVKLVLPKDFQLSQKKIFLNEQPSSRNLKSGRGSFYMKQEIERIDKKLLFHEYLLRRFDNAVTNGKRNKSLDYEVEYMLAGKSTDVQNLEETVKKLLTVRFGINLFYLQTDAAKQAEAQALALTLSTLIGQPIISELVKQALLAAWAFGESIVDMRALLKGKRNALIKNSTNWQLSLSAIMQLGTGEDIQEGMDVEGGVTYTDCLRMLLFLENKDTLAMKAIDRIEQNMRVKNNHLSFHIDSCVVKLRVHNKAVIRDGLSYDFPIYFGYEF